MNKLVNEDDLKKVSGGRDTSKKYTFYARQLYRSKKSIKETITIQADYIDVPYDALISVLYIDIDIDSKYISHEQVPCWYIDENYILAK